MKKSILILLTAMSSLITSAQILELVNPVEVQYGTTSNTSELLEVSWDVVNISGSTMDIGCRIGILQNVAGGEHQYCWGLGCSAWLTENNVLSEIVTLNDGESSNSFHGKYRHNGNAGQAKVNYCWFNNASQLNSVCYEVDFCVDGACILSINENAPVASIEMLTPNPVNSLSAINYHFSSTPESGKFTIYNSLGSLVKEVFLDEKNGTIFIGASEFENGVYFCHIEEKGTIYQTQRFVVSK